MTFADIAYNSILLHTEVLPLCGYRMNMIFYSKHLLNHRNEQVVNGIAQCRRK